jgi:hypothetical protein
MRRAPPANDAHLVDFRTDSSANLTPEYQRALDLLVQRFPFLSARDASDISGVVHIQDQVLSFRGRVPIKILPGGLSWTWNQARSKVAREVPSLGVTVEFGKLVARFPRSRSPSTAIAPPYKLWIYNVISPRGAETVLWCERGIDQPSGPPIQIVQESTFRDEAPSDGPASNVSSRTHLETGSNRPLFTSRRDTRAPLPSELNSGPVTYSLDDEITCYSPKDFESSPY